MSRLPLDPEQQSISPVETISPGDVLWPYLPVNDSVADVVIAALRQKMQSGIAATVGALVLVRGNRLASDAKLLGWLDTLAENTFRN